MRYGVVIIFRKIWGLSPLGEGNDERNCYQTSGLNIFPTDPLDDDDAIFRFAIPGFYEMTQIVSLIKTLRGRIIQ